MPRLSAIYRQDRQRVDANVLISAYRFSNDAVLTELDTAAKTSDSIGAFSFEPILFGKWRD